MKKTQTDILSLEDIPALGEIGIIKLNKEGIFTKTDLLCRYPLDVAEITGMDRDKAAKAFDYCRTLLEKAGMLVKREHTAKELLEERKKIEHLQTGCKGLDAMLTGGIECRAITQLYGIAGSGKTQTGHTLCVQAQRPTEEGGLAGKHPANVLYIDTEDTFRPERILSMCQARGYDAKQIDKVLGGIIVQKAKDAGHQVVIIKNVSHVIHELNVRLIVVDSGTALFRSEYLERGNLSRKQQHLNEMMHLLKNTAENHNLAVVLINQIYHRPDAFGNPEMAYGGNVVAHSSTYIVNLAKSGRKYMATLEKSPMHPKDNCLYDITPAGIVDYVDKKKE